MLTGTETGNNILIVVKKVDGAANALRQQCRQKERCGWMAQPQANEQPVLGKMPRQRVHTLHCLQAMLQLFGRLWPFTHVRLTGLLQNSADHVGFWQKTFPNFFKRHAE